MARFKLCFAFLTDLSLVYCVDACCNKISITYNIQQSNESTSNVLQYVMRNIVFARAVKYNSFGGFVVMDSDWTTNPNIEPGYTYLWITTFERQFEKTNEVRSTIPENFGVGSSFDVVFRTPSVVHHWFVIDIENQMTNTVYLHMNIRPSTGLVVFNSRQGSDWVGENNVSNPVGQGDSIYIATFTYNSIGWTVYINGSQIFSDQHRYNYRNDDEVKFAGFDTFCERIIFYGPL